jgi:uncharacterized protein YukE
MRISVDPDDLRAMSRVFSLAGTEVQHVGQLLSSSARAPSSESVIGDAMAAATYADIINASVEAMSQLVISFGAMEEKLIIASEAYAETESANTVPTES